MTSPTEALAALRAEYDSACSLEHGTTAAVLGAAIAARYFPRLLTIAEAAAAALDQCDSLERGERWWYRLRDTLASLTSEETPAPTLMEAPNETRPHSAPRLDP